MHEPHPYALTSSYACAIMMATEKAAMLRKCTCAGVPSGRTAMYFCWAETSRTLGIFPGCDESGHQHALSRHSAGTQQALIMHSACTQHAISPRSARAQHALSRHSSCTQPALSTQSAQIWGYVPPRFRTRDPAACATRARTPPPQGREPPPPRPPWPPRPSAAAAR